MSAHSDAQELEQRHGGRKHDDRAREARWTLVHHLGHVRPCAAAGHEQFRLATTPLYSAVLPRRARACADPSEGPPRRGAPLVRARPALNSPKRARMRIVQMSGGLDRSKEATGSVMTRVRLAFYDSNPWSDPWVLAGESRLKAPESRSQLGANLARLRVSWCPPQCHADRTVAPLLGPAQREHARSATCAIFSCCIGLKSGIAAFL